MKLVIGRAIELADRPNFTVVEGTESLIELVRRREVGFAAVGTTRGSGLKG